MRFLQQVKEFVSGQGVDNPHPAIVMFSIASNMKWSHLPVAGGIYDQDPELLRRWRIIWREQGENERREAAKRKSEQQRASRKPVRRR